MEVENNCVIFGKQPKQLSTEQTNEIFPTITKHLFTAGTIMTILVLHTGRNDEQQYILISNLCKEAYYCHIATSMDTMRAIHELEL